MVARFFQSMFSFTMLTTLTVFAVAGSAGYFSIYGLVLIFSGAVIPVMIMAGSLEIGKLILTSILFNYWRKMNWLLTTYCTIAVFCLMVITSVGIYGFLSAAYQTNQAPLAQINKRIELLDQEFERKQQRIIQIDKGIEAIPANMVQQRIREKRQLAPERKELQSRIVEIEKEKLEISSAQLETEVHIGPIVKIAEAFGVTKDRAVHLLILLFIFVFDPLAVALTICVNVIISSKKESAINTVNVENVVVPDQPIAPESNKGVEITSNIDNVEVSTPSIVLASPSPVEDAVSVIYVNDNNVGNDVTIQLDPIVESTPTAQPSTNDLQHRKDVEDSLLNSIHKG